MFQLILNLANRYVVVVNFVLQLIDPGMKSPFDPLSREHGEPHNRSIHFDEKKNLFALAGNQTTILAFSSSQPKHYKV